jgi:hypothetical protein
MHQRFSVTTQKSNQRIFAQEHGGGQKIMAKIHLDQPGYSKLENYENSTLLY